MQEVYLNQKTDTPPINEGDTLVGHITNDLSRNGVPKFKKDAEGSSYIVAEAKSDGVRRGKYNLVTYFLNIEEPSEATDTPTPEPQKKLKTFPIDASKDEQQTLPKTIPPDADEEKQARKQAYIIRQHSQDMAIEVFKHNSKEISDDADFWDWVNRFYQDTLNPDKK